MTANELADKLQNEKAKTLLYVATIVDSANMLRQQQAEIEALRNHRAWIKETAVKELTEWEIKECWEEATEMREHFCSQYFDFAQLILKKASKK
jgi:hypothetical protein